jgi:hypothetical protein
MTIPTAYTAHEKPLAETPEQLRARIPGWGVDLDPADRPSTPKLAFQEDLSGAHWEFPERQPEKWPRERSIEHAFVTPVFGTAQPPRGLSGVIRKHAYRRYGEARAAHWLLLIAADRVDAWEHHLGALVTGHPDDPVTETGVLSERRRHGLSSRLETSRADRAHQVLDPVVVAGPWLAAGAAAFVVARRVVRAVRS